MSLYSLSNTRHKSEPRRSPTLVISLPSLHLSLNPLTHPTNMVHFTSIVSTVQLVAIVTVYRLRHPALPTFYNAQHVTWLYNVTVHTVVSVEYVPVTLFLTDFKDIFGKIFRFLIKNRRFF